MSISGLKQKIASILIILALFSFPAYASAGNILDSSKYAWSDNVGYINFEDVLVGDEVLSGHAWSENSGFITFDPAQGGVLNDGTGALSGFAWGEQLGWIDFENVDIDEGGKFSGTAGGELVGTITFDCPNYCDVETEWRQASAPESSSGNGGSRNRVSNVFWDAGALQVGQNNFVPSLPEAGDNGFSFPAGPASAHQNMGQAGTDDSAYPAPFTDQNLALLDDTSEPGKATESSEQGTSEVFQSDSVVFWVVALAAGILILASTLHYTYQLRKKGRFPPS